VAQAHKISFKYCS